MNAEHVAEWVEALRSGGFEQTNSTLVSRLPDDEGNPLDGPEAYCCLGVGCKVADPGDEWSWRGMDLPPFEFHRWLGTLVAEDEVEVAPDDEDLYIDFPEDLFAQGNALAVQNGMAPTLRLRDEVSCSVLNDSLGLTFDQIADLVEFFGVYTKEGGDH